MMKWLQKLGKALMLPVAALPVCGILMGIGYALAPAVMGAEGPTTGAAYTIGFLLVKAGGALIDNMAWCSPSAQLSAWQTTMTAPPVWLVWSAF